MFVLFLWSSRERKVITICSLPHCHCYHHIVITPLWSHMWSYQNRTPRTLYYFRKSVCSVIFTSTTFWQLCIPSSSDLVELWRGCDVHKWEYLATQLRILKIKVLCIIRIALYNYKKTLSQSWLNVLSAGGHGEYWIDIFMYVYMLLQPLLLLIDISNIFQLLQQLFNTHTS